MTIRTTITQNIPTGATGNLRALFQRTMLEGLHTVVDPMVEDVRGRTPYDSIRGAYGTQDLVMGNSVQVGITNQSPIWQYREDDTRPHWAPWGPGTSLANWSNAHGIPPFLVARKIARFGTTGNHILRDSMQKYGTRIDQAVQAALYTFVLESLRSNP